eukprot:45288_1
MAAVLYDWKRKLMHQRDETKNQIKTEYDTQITHCNKLITDCDNLIAIHNAMMQSKLHFERMQVMMQQNLKTLLSANTNITNVSASTHSSEQDGCSMIHSSTATATVSPNVCEEDVATNANITDDASNISAILPSNKEEDAFVAHMTMDDAHQLEVNDMIDHRDTVGRRWGAKIIGKEGTNLHVHYPGWSHEYDIWSDYTVELHRFAKYK